MTVGAGTAVSINIVDSSSNPASFRSTPDAEMQGPNLQSSSDQIVFSTTDGQSDQKDVAKRMEQKLGQALDLINKQREDIDLLLKNVTGLRRGLVSVQESVAQLETINSKYPDTVNLQTELSFMRLQLDAMQAASSEPLQPAPQSRPHQTAKMKGPLARRPLEPATTNRSPTFTATIRESTSSGSSKIQSSGPPASTESRDISMSEDRPPPSANPFEDGQWRTSDQSRHRETLESSPGTFGRADSITVEPQKSSLRNNAVDRLMGPPGPPNSRLGPTESRQQIPSSSEIFPRPTRELSEADTQEYLQRTVATDDAEDTDYEPSNHSASLSSMRPSNVPASVEVQSSLDNILDPVTPSAGEGAYGPAHGGSQDADRSRQSWMDDQRRSSEWYGNAWVDPRELHQNGMTPSRMHNDGSSNMRRGVSRGLGSGRGAKRQKTTRDGKVDGRSVEKQRDAEGYLLRADGTRDMRSARYRDKQSAGEVGGGGADGGGSGGSAAFEEANDTITIGDNNLQPNRVTTEFGKLASSHSVTLQNQQDTQRRRRSSSVKSPPTLQGASVVNFAGATSGLTARTLPSHRALVSGTPHSHNHGSMSLSRSPSPRAGGGWSSPGLTSPFDTLSGRSSPRKAYGDLHLVNGEATGSGVTWASAKAKSEEVKGYPSFSTRNNGFFSRHARKISSSLPRFNMGSRQSYAEKEKLGRGRWSPNGGSRLARLKALLGSITRRMRLRLLIIFGILMAFILFYTTPMHRVYRRASFLGGGSKFVIVLAANQGGGVMEWKGPREWAIERDSVKNKKEYVKKWGYDLEIVDMSTKKRYAHEWRESWEKVDTMRNCMRKYPKAEWFWWLDLNTFIMEPSYSLQSHIFNHISKNTYRDINEYNPLNISHPFSETYLDPTSRSVAGDGSSQSIDLIVPQDCGGFNLGSFFLRRSAWTDRLLDIWWDPVAYEQKHMEWEHKEQDALEHLYTHQPWIRSHTGFIPQRKINSFPSGACGENGEDPRIHYKEQDRDFVVNMAGCEWGRDCWGEMYNFRELSNKLNRTPWEKFKDGIGGVWKAVTRGKKAEDEENKP
ncbi:alpha-1,6-mannosyltransferase [Lambiella insularis]|nr:alpha-1,6-mannosyltransferase [Lambiella insularis]